MSSGSSLSPAADGPPDTVPDQAPVNDKKRKAATPVKTTVTKRVRKTATKEEVEIKNGASAAVSAEKLTKPITAKTRGRKAKVEQKTVKEEEEIEKGEEKVVVKTKAKTTRKKKQETPVSRPKPTIIVFG
jgi:F0F1-type ATP synthase beta subunit